EHRDEEPVVPPGVAQGDRAGGVSAERVGDQPLVTKHLVDVGAIPGHPLQLWDLVAGRTVHVCTASLQRSTARPETCCCPQSAAPGSGRGASAPLRQSAAVAGALAWITR